MTNRDILSSQTKKQSRFSYGFIILLAAFFILLILSGTISSFGVFLKPLLAEFGWSRAAVSSAYSLGLLIGGAMGILAGRISDKFSPRLAVTVGGLFIGAGYLLMTQVKTIWNIHVFYGVLVSIGVGFVPIPLLSLVARWFVRGRGLASGIVMSGVGVGMVFVPSLANLVISRYDWRISYLVLGLACLILIVVFAQFLKLAPSPRRLSNETNAKVDSHNYPVGGLSPREALGTLTFWMIIIVGFFFFFSAQTVLVHIAAHATDIGFSSAAAAGILSVIGFVSIAGTIGGGSLGDTIGNLKTLVIIFLLISLSLVGFRLFGELWMLYFCAAVFGLGYGGFSAVQTPLMADFFGLSNLGLFLSFFILAQNIGGGAGSLVAGYIFDIRGSYEWAFLLGAILSIASLILSILLKPAHRKIQKVLKTGP